MGKSVTWRWAFAFGIGAMTIATPLSAAPPPDADPAQAPWFNSLHQPGSGISCCSIADCRPVDYRTVGDHYEAYIEGEWRPVPPDKVITRADNPTGRAVVCWTKLSGIMCFVRGPET
jgi:hypothetical protein